MVDWFSPKWKLRHLHMGKKLVAAAARIDAFTQSVQFRVHQKRHCSCETGTFLVILNHALRS